MHVVVLGCGRVGSELAARLDRDGHSVAIIDKNARAFSRLPLDYGGKKVEGIGFDREVLEEAGIKEAAQGGAFIAVSNGDNSNIVSARIAREHYRIGQVIARIYDPRRAEIYERLNIPTVASVRWSSQQIQFLLFHHKEELKETFAGGSLMHLQLQVPEHLIGSPVSSVESQGRVEVIGVDRGGTGFLPVTGSTFQDGDVAHFVVSQEGRKDLDVLLTPLAE